MDADSSGKINSEEMEAYIVKLYGKADKEMVAGMMSAADSDKDGQAHPQRRLTRLASLSNCTPPHHPWLSPPCARAKQVDLTEFKAIIRAGPDKK